MPSGLRLLVSATAAALLAVPAADGTTPPVTEFSTSVASPQTITKGPDGNLWFEGTSGLGKITPAGVASAISGVPNLEANDPDDIASGPDGDVWFTTFITGSGGGPGVGKINPTTLAYTEYRIGGDCGLVRGIVPGPDGRLWFACDDTIFEGLIGAITTNGTVSLYSTGYYQEPVGLAAGSDGNIWFITRSTFGKVTPGGAVTVYTANLSGTPLGGIAAGPDGNLWIAEDGADFVAKVTTGAAVTEYPVGPTGEFIGGPWAITAGPDGNLWFTNGFPLHGDDSNNNTRVAKITTSGVVTDYLAGITADSQPDGITTGPDGNIWFTEEAGRIGRLDLHAATPPPTPKPKPAPAVTVIAAVTGKGTLSGGPVKCPRSCRVSLTVGEKLTLTARPARGYHLETWGGGGACLDANFGLKRAARSCALTVRLKDGIPVVDGVVGGTRAFAVPEHATTKVTAIFVKNG